MGYLVTLETQVMQDPTDKSVCLDLPDLREAKVLWVPKELWVFRDPGDPMESQDLTDKRERPDLQGLREALERKEQEET